ncbi:ABC transporter ATP-binding protein [Levyella massiliensis]|uniref:ABC transporter ATP-binding protein n=1 Tax=Levyella massiliensis TaxID=938289 RepID=UPI0003659A88|nr:ABC transporter ATP-binding protein [Levyella massiliensis]
MINHNRKNAIELRGIGRNYEVGRKVIKAVDDVSFEVKEQEVFALLGPNGAGKSTIIKILTTLLAPSYGEAKVLGFDCYKERKKVRKEINFVFGGEAGLYWRLTGRENLQFFSDLYKIPYKISKNRIEELLETVGLNESADQRVEQYSKGMKQRLLIARGLVNSPKILFLDEPTIGLDPIGAALLRELIRNLNKQGTTIMITTHYMEDVEILCDRMAFINNGRLVDIGSKEELKSRHLAEGSSIEELYIKILKR